MIPLYTAEMAKKIDKTLVEDFSLQGIVLMENAGRSVASHVSELMKDKNKNGKVLICAGPGNNGGDGFVAGRHLLNYGYEVKLITSLPMFELYKGDALINANAFVKMGGNICFSNELSDLKLEKMIKDADLCIDALLGVGFKGAPQGEIARLIEAINKASLVVSIDVPSGVDSSSGRVPGVAVKADVTVTMHLHKIGLYVAPGCIYAGKVLLADIGVPPMLGALTFNANCFLWNEESSIDALPCRLPDMHKGDRGSVAVLGGSDLYRGAPLLTSLGALRAGAGVVYMILPEKVYEQTGQFLPEAIGVPVRSDEYFLTTKALDAISAIEDKIDVLIVGPGMGRRKETVDLAVKLWQEYPKNMIYDADGLYALSLNSAALDRRDNVILTPHEGEAGRLLGCNASRVHENRLEATERLSLKYGPVVLKGFHSIIGDGLRYLVCNAGSPALSVPGSGDVLSGVIGALYASGLDPVDSAGLAVWLHAKAGENLSCLEGVDGSLAREIADQVRFVMGDIRYAKEKNRLGRRVGKDGKDTPAWL